jgi:hypothetical protein
LLEWPKGICQLEKLEIRGVDDGRPTSALASDFAFLHLWRFFLGPSHPIHIDSPEYFEKMRAEFASARASDGLALHRSISQLGLSLLYRIGDRQVPSK